MKGDSVRCMCFSQICWSNLHRQLEDKIIFLEILKKKNGLLTKDSSFLLEKEINMTSFEGEIKRVNFNKGSIRSLLIC